MIRFSRFMTALVWAFLLLSCSRNAQIHDIVMLFDQPASRWEECIPLGNGHIGMMPDGGINKETITLNDITLWSGAPYDASNPKALSSLPEIRQLLLDGRNYDAQQLMYETFVCGGEGSGQGQGAGVPFGCYQTLGTMTLDFHLGDDLQIPNDYQRSLNLGNAISSVDYTVENHHYTREFFLSREDDVAVIHIMSDTALSVDIALSRPECATVSAVENGLVMQGQLPSNVEGVEGMGYYAKVIKLSDNPKEVTLLFASATDFMCDDPEQYVNERITNAIHRGYDQLMERHRKSYQPLYDRVELDLNDAIKNDAHPRALEEVLGRG